MFETSEPQPAAPLQPVVDENLSSPIVTYILIGVTVVIYLLQIGTDYLLQVDLPSVLGMKINEYIVAGQYWRLVTPMLLHGSIFHIGFNMYALVSIGTGLERRFGHGRFLVLYLVGAFTGNVFSFLLSPHNSLGASTAIFGLLGAEMVFLYQNRELFGSRARQALQSVISVAAVNFLIGLSPGIDNWGHLGGLIGGLIFTWFGGPQLKLQGQFPYFRIEDQRNPAGPVLGAALAIILFGILAALKIYGVTWLQLAN